MAALRPDDSQRHNPRECWCGIDHGRAEPVNLAGVDWRNVEPAPFEYHACSACGHVETRQADLEPPRKCERCGAHFTALVSFGDLDAAEAFSDEPCNDLLDDAIERQTGRHPAR